MSKKVLIVGGVAGGASAAARVRRLDESAQIIMFEKGPHVSFSNCSLPYHLSGIVPEADWLVLVDPETFKVKYNIEARVNNEVIAIDRQAKSVTVKNVLTGETYDETYDKLVLSPGANPIVPNIEGARNENVFMVRNVVDIDKLNKFLKKDSISDDNNRKNNISDVVVIGGGFIGLEVAENLRKVGYNITLVEAADQVLAPFDYDMVQMVHKALVDHGVNLIVGDGIAKVLPEAIELASGKQVPAQAVVMAIGVRPETSLAVAAGLEIGKTGGIKVDHNYVTSDPDIYAVGDAIEVFHRLLHTPTRLALAGPAIRQARAAADHMYGKPHQNKGVIGSSVVEVFDMNFASTGLTVKAAERAGIPVDSVYVMPGDKVGLMPDVNVMHFKLVYEVPTGRILGAQAAGKGNVDKRVDVIATLVTLGGTVDDLKELELCYAPPFGTGRDVVNIAALVAINTLNGDFAEVKVTQARELVESGAFIVDVREPGEFRHGHLNNAVNIPLSQLRDRVSEIPRDVPVYVHCRSSARSYNAYRVLQGLGYTHVKNIQGSFLGICLYEYFNDLATGRTPIVTKYNFN
ncbi:MAG: pyridine nucleotide-disulfide oxidoreductase [Clostridia bacterium]|nr:pyridine nucleotide-disulfide oxidoreductase [Clostridia bacterium]NCC75457.1 pyridine nucleotide-disulfide oxidoreductase [Clostridia bacterium]